MYNPNLPLCYFSAMPPPSEFPKSMNENLEKDGETSGFRFFGDELAELIWNNGQIMMQELSNSVTQVLDSNTLITQLNSHITCDDSCVGNIIIDQPGEAILDEHFSSVMSSGLMVSRSIPLSLEHSIDNDCPREYLCSEPLLLPNSPSPYCPISDYSWDINHATHLAQDTDLVDNNDLTCEVTEKSMPIVLQSSSNFSHFERPVIHVKADNSYAHLVSSHDHHGQIMGFERLHSSRKDIDLHGEKHNIKSSLTESSNKRADISSSAGDVNDKASCKQRQDGAGESKRSRAKAASEDRNLSERRRRFRINEKMHSLQQLIPNSRKADMASVLDEAIEYIKALQFQIQIMSRIQQFMQIGAAAHVPQCFPSFQRLCSNFVYGQQLHHPRSHNMNTLFPRTVPPVKNNIPLTYCPVISNPSSSSRIKPTKVLVTKHCEEGTSSCLINHISSSDGYKVRDGDDNNDSNQGTAAARKF